LQPQAARATWQRTAALDADAGAPGAPQALLGADTLRAMMPSLDSSVTGAPAEAGGGGGGGDAGAWALGGDADAMRTPSLEARQERRCARCAAAPARPHRPCRHEWLPQALTLARRAASACRAALSRSFGVGSCVRRIR